MPQNQVLVLFVFMAVRKKLVEWDLYGTIFWFYSTK